jgi:hypothetical protein
MASRIEWALKNRDVLLRQQLQLYERLAERSWTTVVGEYVAIMDGMSGNAARIEGTA